MSAGRCLSEQYILRVIFRKYIFKSSVEMVLFPLNYLYLFFLYELTQNISSASRSFAHNCFVVRHVTLASLTCIPIYRYGKYFFVISSYISKTAPMDGLVFYHIYIYIISANRHSKIHNSYPSKTDSTLCTNPDNTNRHTYPD